MQGEDRLRTLIGHAFLGLQEVVGRLTRLVVVNLGGELPGQSCLIVGPTADFSVHQEFKELFMQTSQIFTNGRDRVDSPAEPRAL